MPIKRKYLFASLGGPPYWQIIIKIIHIPEEPYDAEGCSMHQGYDDNHIH